MYDFDTVVDRRNTGSLKWDVAKNELPMWVADMDFPAPQPVLDALRQRVDHGVVGQVGQAIDLAQQRVERKRDIRGGADAGFDDFKAVIGREGFVSFDGREGIDLAGRVEDADLLRIRQHGADGGQLRGDGQRVGSAGHCADCLAVRIGKTGGKGIGNGGEDRRNVTRGIVAGLRHRRGNTYH